MNISNPFVKFPQIEKYSFDKYTDRRGSFTPLEMSTIVKSVNFNIDQINFVENRRNVLRGAHYQTQPYRQTKLISCTRGSIIDIVIDIDPTSPTYLQMDCCRLSKSVRSRISFIKIPDTFAHGYFSEGVSSVLYMVEGAYSPQNEVSINLMEGIFKNDTLRLLPYKFATYSDKDQNGLVLHDRFFNLPV